MLRDEGRRAAERLRRGARRRHRRARRPSTSTACPRASEHGGRARRSLRAFLIAGLVLFTGAVLYLGAPVIVPVVEALVVWFVLNAMANGAPAAAGVGRGCPGGRRCCSRRPSCWCSALLVVQSTVATIASLGPRAAGLQQALDPTVARLAAPSASTPRRWSTGLLDSLGLEAMVRVVVAGMIGLVSHFSIVAIYVGFLLVDQQFFERKLAALVPDPGRRERARAVLARVGERHPDLSLDHDAGQRADRRPQLPGPRRGRGRARLLPGRDDLHPELHPDDRLDHRHGAARGLRADAVPGARPDARGARRRRARAVRRSATSCCRGWPAARSTSASS